MVGGGTWERIKEYDINQGWRRTQTNERERQEKTEPHQRSWLQRDWEVDFDTLRVRVRRDNLTCSFFYFFLFDPNQMKNNNEFNKFF